MRIDSGTSSIQMLKAQQAWETRKAGKAQQSTQTSDPIATEKTAPAVSSVPSGNTPSLSPQWSRKVNEIQQIAQKAGFTGLTETDIRSAYTQGGSLLADYRV